MLKRQYYNVVKKNTREWWIMLKPQALGRQHKELCIMEMQLRTQALGGIVGNV